MCLSMLPAMLVPLKVEGGSRVPDPLRHLPPLIQSVVIVLSYGVNRAVIRRAHNAPRIYLHPPTKPQGESIHAD